MASERALRFVRGFADRRHAAAHRGQVELHVSLEDIARLVHLARMGARVAETASDGCHDLPAENDLTVKERAVLSRLVERGGAFVRGADVGVVRRLERDHGFATLTDNGHMLGPGRRSDGERWYAEPTDTGRSKLASLGDTTESGSVAS